MDKAISNDDNYNNSTYFIQKYLKDLGPLKLCQIKGQLKLPTLMQGFVKNFNGILRIRYGMQLDL